MNKLVLLGVTATALFAAVPDVRAEFKVVIKTGRDRCERPRYYQPAPVVIYQQPYYYQPAPVIIYQQPRYYRPRYEKRYYRGVDPNRCDYRW